MQTGRESKRRAHGALLLIAFPGNWVEWTLSNSKRSSRCSAYQFDGAAAETEYVGLVAEADERRGRLSVERLQRQLWTDRCFRQGGVVVDWRLAIEGYRKCKPITIVSVCRRNSY